MGFTQARRWGLLALTFVVGICAGYLAWDIISFPFFNPEGVVGPLTLISFNPMNNQVRFVVFILMPALVLLAAQRWLRHLSHGALPQSEVEWKSQNLEAYQLLFRISCWVTCLFAISSVCLFFAQPFDTSPLDFFHEGENLVPALNWVNGAGAWSASFVIHGAFSDIFRTVMAWKILGCVSIGAERFGITLLHDLSCATVPALFLCCAFVIRRTGGPVAALAFLAIMLPGYAVLSYPWSFLVTFGHPGFHLPLIDTLERDTPYIIGFGILLLTLNGKATWPYFIVGLFIPLCLFWSIDRGAFFAALSLVGCALHAAYAPGGIQSPRSWFPGMWILLGSLTGLGVIFLVFGPNEIRASIDITGNWFGVKEFL